MDIINLNINNSWYNYLKHEFERDYFQNLLSFLEQEYNNKIVYPGKSDIFSAFNLTPLDKVKVVIIGQDPYHGKNQAHGLSFSVKPDIKIPPSLKNIYKELQSDLNIPIAHHGFLESWAKNGVLMLNNILTVCHASPASHKGRGWEIFTDKAIEIINDKLDNIVFLLWGSHAQKKSINLDNNKHLILKSSHPSPFSAYKGFLGCKHFSKANNYLINCNKGVIDWSLPEYINPLTS